MEGLLVRCPYAHHSHGTNTYTVAVFQPDVPRRFAYTNSPDLGHLPEIHVYVEQRSQREYRRRDSELDVSGRTTFHRIDSLSEHDLERSVTDRPGTVLLVEYTRPVRVGRPSRYDLSHTD